MKSTSYIGKWSSNHSSTTKNASPPLLRRTSSKLLPFYPQLAPRKKNTCVTPIHSLYHFLTFLITSNLNHLLRVEFIYGKQLMWWLMERRGQEGRDDWEEERRGSFGFIFHIYCWWLWMEREVLYWLWWWRKWVRAIEHVRRKRGLWWWWWWLRHWGERFLWWWRLLWWTWGETRGYVVGGSE